MRAFAFWLCICLALMLMGLTLGQLPNHWKGAVLSGILAVVNAGLLVWVLKGK